MFKLPVCRICLAHDIPMRLIVNKSLQKMYEVLTKIPFETDDSRPMLVCYICCARLHNSYKLAKSCLRSEELFQQMMNTDEATPKNLEQLPCTKLFKITSAVHLSYSGENNETYMSHSGESDDDTEEQTVSDGQTVVDDVEVKEELITDLKSELGEKRGSLADFFQYTDTENPLWIQSSADTCMPLKRESCEERLKGDDVISSDPEDETLNIDECPKSRIPQKIVKIILKRCDESSDEEIDVVTIDKKQSVYTPMVRRSLRRKSAPRCHQPCCPDLDRHQARVTDPDLHRVRGPGPDRHRVRGLDRHRVCGPDRRPACLAGHKRRLACGPGRDRRRALGPGYNCRPPHGPGPDRRRARGPVSDFRRFNTDEDSEIESPEISFRVVHNDKEKRRREDLKNLFDDLKKQVPATSAKDRVPKIVILREAAVLCRRLTQEDLEWKMLKKKQDQLMTKLIKLKRLTVPSRYRSY